MSAWGDLRIPATDISLGGLTMFLVKKHFVKQILIADFGLCYLASMN